MKTIKFKLGSRQAEELLRMADWASADLDSDQSESNPSVGKKSAKAAYAALNRLSEAIADKLGR